VKTAFRNEGKIKTFSGEEKLRICCQQTFAKRLAKESYLGRNEMIKF